ncbi:MAG: hypothetical protein ICV60_13585 [Pyrinomonadaceae bacterium]|nr:hypothetical protein [Pyrinomonadaceae bacterium]
MKLYLPALLILISMFVITPGQTTDSHVRTEYLPKVKMTKVETDMMFVINTPEQFMQLSLEARYPKQQLVTPPKTINVIIFSNSPRLIYESTKDQNLTVVTDGESWKAGELTYWSGKGERTKAGQEIFVNEKRAGLGLENPLPAGARVREGKDIDGLYMEWLSINLKWEQFTKIATAKTVEFQIGKTRFQFTENQMNTVRAFASHLTP